MRYIDISPCIAQSSTLDFDIKQLIVVPLLIIGSFFCILVIRHRARRARHRALDTLHTIAGLSMDSVIDPRLKANGVSMPCFWILSRLACGYDACVRVCVGDFSALTFFTLTNLYSIDGLWCVAFHTGASDESNLRLISNNLLNSTMTLDERDKRVPLEYNQLATCWTSYSNTDSPYAKNPDEPIRNILLADSGVIALEAIEGWVLLVGPGLEAPEAPVSTVKAAMKLLPYLRIQAADKRKIVKSSLEA